MPSQRPGDRLARCAQHSLAYDPALASGCALCRRTTPQAKERAGTLWPLLALALLTALGASAWLLRPARSRDADPVAARQGLDAVPGRLDAVPGRVGRLSTTNEAGRSGSYYLPGSAGGSPIPVLVAIHGTGGSGADMLTTFQALAEKHAFAIVAPDSRRSPDGQLTWQVGDTPGDVTPDLTHIVACLDELRRLVDGELVLAADVLVAGYSGGASSAPYVATNRDGFTAFAVLHGGAFPGGFGSRRVRGWFSTGQGDPLRPAARVREVADAARAKGLEVVYRDFPGGHELSAAEAAALVEWWRSAAGSGLGATP